MSLINIQRITTYMKDWTPDEASIAIASADKYLDYYAGTHDIKLYPEQPVPYGSISYEVARKKRRVEAFVDQSVFGLSYYGIGYPVEESKNNEVIVTVILPPDYFSKKQFSYLTGKSGEIWKPIPIEEIAYIESYQKKTWIYTADNQYSIIYSLKTLQQHLPDSFLRIHRSYIVNISFIQQIFRDMSANLVISLKKTGHPPLIVSQTYVKHVRKMLGF
ncbi:LytTR family transcriptional regulator DNA-binding domain-containing protein [Salicibibacter cibi]|uniref:LytTR family transcriptional regulator DNA-binding domain-containing protein n=1 Tax=Salicibibacter cibi TaxID=2743001 RepID=A0A7T6ZDW4_9BACI|nr:LytTR family DNA-binding domain-containing protein [Salicibibacter cibi]QQK81706.1 LytTR family transcriptional regulator DNA-binding domain-containing protein [Salicibibacter cibi]